MAIETPHPLYSKALPDWQQMRVTFKGERAVKSTGRVFLPATSGMVADGVDTQDPKGKGRAAYDAYRVRAHFPDFVKQGVKAALGVMHNKPAKIELPEALEPLREAATLKGESLQLLLRSVNAEQLITGRVGMLLDLSVSADGAAARPYVALYQAEHVLNWDEGERDLTRPESLNLVVLDESEYVRTDSFEWEFREKYRVLVLGQVEPNEQTGGGVYRVGVFKEKGAQFSEAGLLEPSLAGKKLQRLPFVFVNPTDITPTPDDPPLLGLSNLALAIYRGEADYRQALFMQGQDTLVVQGGEQDTEYRTGAGAVLTPPIGGDAKYIGVDGSGLSEMRSALENDYSRAGKKSGELLDEVSREKESGEALRVRVAAKTATLTEIALTSAFALQELLRIAAEWLGANPEEVVVTPNLDFVDDQMAGDELVQLMSAKQLGAPLSLESTHQLMQKRGMTEKSFDEELEAIEKEKELELVPAPTTNEDGPVDDEGQPGAKPAPKE
jgi:hypothetical protein